MSTPPEFLRSMLDGAFEASFVVSPNGTIWHMNESARRTFHVVDGRSGGVPVSTYLSFCTSASPNGEMMQLSWADVSNLDSFVNGKRNAECVGTTSSGGHFPATVNLVRVANDASETRTGQSSAPETTSGRRNNNVLYYCLYIDLTAARLQVASLEEEVARLSATNDAIIRASGQLLVIIDNGGFIRSVSGGLSQMFGYDEDSFMASRNVNFLIQERGGSRLIFEDHDQRQVQGRHCDGSILDLEVGFGSLSTGNTAIMIKNTTETRERLIGKNLEGVQSVMVDAAFNPMFCTNNAGIITTANQAAADELGWLKSEFIGKNISMVVGGSHKRHHDSYIQRYNETKEKRMIGKQREIRCQRKNGTEFAGELGLTEIPTGFCGFIRKTTQQKIYEKNTSAELANQKNITRGILDASFDALFVINNRGIIQQANKTSTRVFGYTREEFVGSNISIIMTSDVAAEHDQYLRNYLKTGVKKMIGTQREVTARRKDGSTFTCVLGLSQIRDMDLFCGFIRDLTSEKAAQSEIVEGHERMAKIVDASFDALFCINERGIIQKVNSASSRVFGYTEEEFLGKNINMIMPGEHACNHDSYLKNYIATGLKKMIGAQRQVEGKRKNGTRFPCSLGLSELSNNGSGEREFVGFIKDITFQKGLLLAENITGGILDASFDSLFVIDSQGIIQQVNETSTKVFGYTKEELEGSNINILMTSDVAAEHDQYLRNYLRTGVKKMIGTQREVTARRKNGSTFTSVLGLSQIKDMDLFCGFIRDLTSEKAAQSEIVEGHERMTKIVDASFDALFCINERGIIQQVNSASSRVFGYTEEEFLGQNINMIMPEKHALNHDSYLERYIATGIKKMIGTQREVEGKRKNGTYFPCILGLSELSNNGTGEREFIGFIKDVTVQKSLLLAENITGGILDASFDALFVIDSQGIIQQVNETSTAVFGYTKEELVGSNINILMTRDIAAEHDQYLRNYLRTGVKKMIGTQREVTARRKDGSTFTCVLGLSQIKNTNLLAGSLFCGFIRDLTSEKAAQSKIVEGHERMVEIVDASFDALFCINERGTIQHVNEASSRVFGYTEEEFLGQNINMIMPDKHALNHDSYLDRYIATGFKKMMGMEREVEAKRKDGTCFPCILGLSELRSNVTGQREFIGFIKDVTVQKSLLFAEAERTASDSLLFNILPPHIAQRLKQDPSHIADHYENTTILFADIVGFTNRATLMTPHDVVTMLNNLFSRFDSLVGRYDINKVKTIGDCYMVTSIPSSDLEHDGCARVCRFALDLMKAVRAFNNTGPQHGQIELRVGIACGQVVAGVVGTKRFLFDMWGDAVNVAARMEQHGLPGQIQTTKEVVDNAGSDFCFERRGPLLVKGKGTMDTYILKSAKENELRRSAYHSWNPRSTPSMRAKSTIT